MSATEPDRPQSEANSMPGHKERGWNVLFAFTRKTHLPVLLTAIILSLAAGLLLPATVVFLGRVFNSFSEYAAGKIDATTFTHEINDSVYAFLTIGAATFALRGGLFNFWLHFGEMQARCAREELFRALLGTDLEWYDLQKTGVETTLTRTQT